MQDEHWDRASHSNFAWQMGVTPTLYHLQLPHGDIRLNLTYLDTECWSFELPRSVILLIARGQRQSTAHSLFMHAQHTCYISCASLSIQHPFTVPSAIISKSDYCCGPVWTEPNANSFLTTSCPCCVSYLLTNPSPPSSHGSGGGFIQHCGSHACGQKRLCWAAGCLVLGVHAVFFGKY